MYTSSTCKYALNGIWRAATRASDRCIFSGGGDDDLATVQLCEQKLFFN